MVWKINLAGIAKGLTTLFSKIFEAKVSRSIELPGVAGRISLVDPVERQLFRVKAAKLTQLLMEFIRADLADGKADSCARLEAWLQTELTRIYGK